MLAQPATLYFQATYEQGALNQSWLSPSNWYYSLSPLIGAGRVPTSADSVILTTSPVIIGPNNVAVQTMIVEGDIAIGGGDIELVNLITDNADMSFTDSTVTVQSEWDLLYGAILNSSTVIVDSGAGLVVESNSFLNVNNSVLYDIGGIILQNMSGISFNSGTNQLSILPSASLSGDGMTSVTAGGGSLLFDNNGLVQGNTGLLQLSLDNTTWSNSLGLGAYATAASNAVIKLSGSVTFQTNATNLVVGPGVTWFWVNDPLSILGVLQVGAVDPMTGLPDPGTVLFDPTTVSGNGLIHVLGSPSQPSTLLWDDGTISGPVVQIDPYGQLILTNYLGWTLSGGTVNNAGTTLWLANAGSFYMVNGAVFNNLAGALFSDQNTNNASIASGTGLASVFNNAGTFRKSAGTTTTDFGPFLDNTGLIDVQAGTMQLGPGTNAGQFNVAAGSQLTFYSGTNVQLAGASFTGEGSFLVSYSGDLWLGAGLTISNLEVLGGRLDGPGDLTVSGSLNVGQQAILQGGGAINVDTGATFIITNYYGVTLGRTVNNSGSAVLAAADGITASQGMAWNNLPGSVFQMQNGGGNLAVNYSGAPPAFNNAGLFSNSAYGSLIYWAFTNSGSVQINSGDMLDFERGFTQTAGGTFVGAGAAIYLPQASSDVLLILGGELSGTGTIYADVVNSGLVHPGGPAGALTISGGFTNNSNGVLAIEIGGPSSGGQYGQLNLGYSKAALGGALNVIFDNGYVPAVGDHYAIVSASIVSGGSVTGVFATLNGLRPANGLVLVPHYSASGVVLAVANDPTLSFPARVGDTLSFSFPTTAGLTNIVEYTDSLGPANWQTLSNVIGNGSPAVITDPSATSPQRFYRVSFK